MTVWEAPGYWLSDNLRTRTPTAGVSAMVGVATTAPVRELLVEMARGIQPEGLLRAVSFRLSNFYSPDHASALTMSTLMLRGSEDRINPRQSNRDLLLPHLAQGRLEMLPGLGSLPEMEAPQVFARLVRQFLSQQ